MSKFAYKQEGKDLYELLHTTYTVRNKHEKLEGKDEASFDTPFMIPSPNASITPLVMGFLAMFTFQLDNTKR